MSIYGEFPQRLGDFRLTCPDKLRREIPGSNIFEKQSPDNCCGKSGKKGIDESMEEDFSHILFCPQQSESCGYCQSNGGDGGKLKKFRINGCDKIAEVIDVAVAQRPKDTSEDECCHPESQLFPVESRLFFCRFHNFPFGFMLKNLIDNIHWKAGKNKYNSQLSRNFSKSVFSSLFKGRTFLYIKIFSDLNNVPFTGESLYLSDFQ